MANKKRDAAKERQWREAVKRFTRSGLSVRAFCQKERLSEPSFYAWRRTLARRNQSEKQAASFLPVRVIDRVAHGAITLELAGGRVLRLPEAIPAARLAEIVVALEARAGQ